MEIYARDVMETSFQTLTVDLTISDAVTRFREAERKLGRRVFGMMVMGEGGEMAGMLSMTDILLFMAPKHIRLWGEMEDIDTEGYLAEACRRGGKVRVGDIMTKELITVSPDTHLLMVADTMLRKHVRRIPVVAEGKVAGIVYLSGVFTHISGGLA